MAPWRHTWISKAGKRTLGERVLRRVHECLLHAILEMELVLGVKRLEDASHRGDSHQGPESTAKAFFQGAEFHALRKMQDKHGVKIAPCVLDDGNVFRVLEFMAIAAVWLKM